MGAVGFVGALITYSAQRALDRQHAVLAERRKLYEECAGVIASLMYKSIKVNSEIHSERRDKLNVAGQRLYVIAPIRVREAFREIVAHFREKEGEADANGNIHDFFDDTAAALVDALLDEMRKDALPNSLWSR